MLLDVGELVDEEPQFDGGPQVAVHALLGSAWAHHSSTGNAQVTLKLDVHRLAPSPAAAQAMGLRMWRMLTTHPDGELRVQTAFVHRKSSPLIDWVMRASCNSVRHEEVDIDTAPFERAASIHINFDFTVSLPDDNDFEL